MRQSTPTTALPPSASSAFSIGIAGREIDHRHTRDDAGDDLLDVRQDVSAIIVDAQAADPGIEQLDRLSAGGDLGVQVPRDGAGKPLHQRLPGTGVAIHQRLGVQVIAAGSPFDRVAGQRKRCSGKTDQRADGREDRDASAARSPSRSAAHRHSPVPAHDRRPRLRAPDCGSPARRRRRIPGPSPIGSRIGSRSEKMMAASTPSRWTAVHITSLQSAGFLQSSRNETFARTSRYSAM